MTASGPRELVVLIDEEFVGDRGSVKVAWLVAHNDGFVPARHSPGARSQRLDTGPGVVWRTRVEVELVRGTRVQRVETRPGARRGSTLDHLTGGAKSSRAGVVRTFFAVGSRGALEPESRPTRPMK